jgi:two-component system, probable response regulator PhcQ
VTLKAEALADKKSGTILFVDDEPLSLKYFKASVGKYANVKTASSPDAAMEILASAGDEISVVVSDERMPRDSGVSFLSDVRKSWPSTVRILTSAYANIDNLQHAINDAAIYRFVPKPWNLDELCAAMQDALHVERSAEALVEPVLGPTTSGGDAESANLALLSILASGFDAPLKSLDSEAQQLAQLAGPQSLEASQNAASYLASWSSRLRLGKLAASATQIQRDIEHCKSLARSIGNLAHSLGSPAAVQTSSMADTIAEVVELSMAAHWETWPSNFNRTEDFEYSVPREIMKFVVANLLRGTTKSASRMASPPRIELRSHAEHNEVQIVVASDCAPISLDANPTWRTVRCALWAFGGELLSSTDENLGTSTLTMCLPKP